jgi:hypothetical protein
MSTAETQHFPAIRNAANHGTTHATPARDKGNGGSHVGRGIAFGISSYTHAWFNFMPRPAGHRSLEQELRSFRESAPQKATTHPHLEQKDGACRIWKLGFRQFSPIKDRLVMSEVDPNAVTQRDWDLCRITDCPGHLADPAQGTCYVHPASAGQSADLILPTDC